MWLRLATAAMGTRFELVLEGRDPAHARAAAEAALECVEAADARWSRFRSDSLVARINRDAHRDPVRLDGETFALLERCEQLRLDTQGAFDICVGTPMDRLRADPGVACPGAAGGLELDARHASVRLTRAGSALDLGAIGKGHALDLAAALLRELGVDSALLHGGTSSVIAFGEPPPQERAPALHGRARGWGLALGPSFQDERLQLLDKALSVSASRSKRDAQTWAHVLDPRSGRTLQGELHAAVRARSAADADAWSTALLVLAARPEREALPSLLDTLALPAGFDCRVQFDTRAISRTLHWPPLLTASCAR